MKAMVKNMIKQIRAITSPLLKKANEDDISAIAGQSAFYMILAFFPLSMFAVSVLQGMHIPFETLDDFLSLVLSRELSSYLSGFLSDIYADSVSVSVISFAVTLYCASQGMHAVIRGLVRIYGAPGRRGWIRQRITAMLATLILVAVFGLTLSVCVLGRSLDSLISPRMCFIPFFIGLMYKLRYALVFVYLTAVFTVLYAKLPYAEKRLDFHSLAAELPGALFCSGMWFLLSSGLSVYVDDLGGFSVYGGLARIAMMLIWLYLCMLLIMYGAEINCVYRRT